MNAKHQFSRITTVHLVCSLVMVYLIVLNYTNNHNCEISDRSDEIKLDSKNLHIYPNPKQELVEHIEITMKDSTPEDSTPEDSTQKIILTNLSKPTKQESLTARFASRNTNYDIACLNTKKRAPTGYAGYYLTSQKYNLFSCLAMKTGSSSWFYTIWELQNPGKPPAKTGFWSVMAGQKKFVNNQQKSQVKKPRGESSFTRFMTTRHPLTRLYSGWNEHMRVVDGKPVGAQWRNFKLLDKAEWGETHVCTWEKFVELFATGEYVINEHHYPVSKLCGGCDISWDFIVKQETMDEDNEFILKVVKAPETVHVGNKNQIGFVKKDPFSYLVNYCQFSDGVIDKIQQYYSQDFLFYSYDKFSREQVCGDKPRNSE